MAKKGLTSIEAAALILSDGKTTDPTMAASISDGNDLDMDALQRSHLRRMMGFDFRMKVAPNKIHVSSKQEPYVTTYCKLKEGDVLETFNGFGLTNEDVIDRLVDACSRLKAKWETANDTKQTD